jgi:long-chain acyl-CoA synthetase
MNNLNEINRTFDILSYNEKHQPLNKALSIKRKGKWESFSTKDYREHADHFSLGFMALGFKKGDKIATVINNRPEWNFIDFGMSQLGVVHVGIYPTISEEEYLHILSHSDAKILIVANKELYEKLLPVYKQIDSIKEIYSIEEIEGVKNTRTIQELGAKQDAAAKDELEKRKAEVLPDDLLTLIYTSGTTGLSKGVMLSHKNVVSNVILATQFVTYQKPGNRAFSFLPMSHILERTGNYLWQLVGLELYYAESIETLIDDMKEASPHTFITVPRIFEKIYDKIINKGRELSGVKKALFFWAVKLGDQYDPDPAKRSAFYNFKLKIADKLIFTKWREALGGSIMGVISGGAALQPRLARAFWGAGIFVQEGYGLTETSPLVSATGFAHPYVRFGAVGFIPDSIKVKIAEDGEILVQGDNVMHGYYKDPEKTAEALADGWFHTGDIGKIEDNFLFITDRKKEIFKLSGGKYVAPQIVENKLKESNFIEQIMVIGENERFTGALIVPDFEYLHNWCTLHHLQYRDNKDLIENPKIIARFQRELDHFNKKIDHVSQIKVFRLICENWTPDTGELSPTLKLKRKVIMKKYEHKIISIYQQTK